MFLATLLVMLLLLCRLVYMNQFGKGKRRKKPAKTLIVIGSGGHTSEMLDHVKNLDPKLYEPRLYVMADVDKSSKYKIREIEEKLKLKKHTRFEIVRIPRSRYVNQSYMTSVFSTFYSIIKCIPVVIKFKPDLVLCNGPGTCIPVCLEDLLKVFFIKTHIASTELLMPLKGIKVLEMAGLAPAPFCGAILADFGASVIRIGKVTSGSDGDCLTNGKRSLALNLKDENGKKIFLKLASKADVLIEPFRKGVMENLNLGPEKLTELNPKLIYARLTGFGQHGPYSRMAGHDINFLGMSGVLSFLGRKHEKPTAPVNLLADFGGGGLTCALGIVLALFERSNSGRGQIIDCSMVEGAAYLSSWLFRAQKLPIWGGERGNNILDTGAHFYDTYETKDGKYLAIGSLEPEFYQILIDNLKTDKLEGQWTNFDKKRQILTEIIKSKTRGEWCEIFDGTDACVTPVLDQTDVAQHPHNQDRKSFITTADGLLVPQPAPKLSRTQGISKAYLPHVENGKDTKEILLEIGYRRTEIEDFESKGIVKTTNQSKL